MNPRKPRLRSRHRSDAASALLVSLMLIALLCAVAGAAFYLSDETNRRTARQNRFSSVEVAGDAAQDVVYGRFVRSVNAHTGLTPSITDAATVGTPANATFPAITGAISFSSIPSLSAYTVSNITLTPLLPDGTAGTDYPSWTTWASNRAAYNAVANKYVINIPDLYSPGTFAQATAYKASLTITPTATGLLAPSSPQQVVRYFQSSQVSPFSYNTFTEGTFEDFDWGQGYDEETNIYAAQNIKLDHKGTIVDGAMRYGGAFYGPSGVAGNTSNLVFEDPTTKATVDPYASGLLQQTSKIEVVPDLVDVIAHNSDGSRSASAEFATATADDFSQREIIEPPSNLTTGDTAPDQIAQRRIFTQADQRVKVSTYANPYGATISKMYGLPPTLATATFYSASGAVQAIYNGVPSTSGSSGSTAWYLASGGTAASAAVVNALNVNTVDSNTPFYDPSRRYDSSSLGTGQPGQPASSNYNAAIETVDVNVGALTPTINGNPSAFPAGIIYVWDDGASGQKNGVRLYNGGVLPDEGLTVGSTNPVYVKGDYNTGTVLSSSNNINATVTSQPYANTEGYNNGASESASDRTVAGYTPKAAGIIGDTVTTLSQNWKDSLSANGTTQYAQSTTYNASMIFGSGDSNSLLADDTFSNSTYSCVQTLEYWNNCRWSQGGNQMSLYHSLYNKHKAPPSWISGGWLVVENDYSPSTTRLPLKWGYLVFSRGRYARSAQ